MQERREQEERELRGTRCIHIQLAACRRKGSNLEKWKKVEVEEEEEEASMASSQTQAVRRWRSPLGQRRNEAFPLRFVIFPPITVSVETRRNKWPVKRGTTESIRESHMAGSCGDEGGRQLKNHTDTSYMRIISCSLLLRNLCSVIIQISNRFESSVTKI